MKKTAGPSQDNPYAAASQYSSEGMVAQAHLAMHYFLLVTSVAVVAGTCAYWAEDGLFCVLAVSVLLARLLAPMLPGADLMRSIAFLLITWGCTYLGVLATDIDMLVRIAAHTELAMVMGWIGLFYSLVAIATLIVLELLCAFVVSIIAPHHRDL
ncbi:MAG: hypothetical protein ACTHK7_19165 [Aureliella sp.]